MSKQLGNSPDALALIDEFGADGVRYGIMASAPAGGDILFDEKLCELGRNFCNKLWNALRLVKSWQVDGDRASEPGKILADRWMEARIHEVDQQLREQYTQYRLSEAVSGLYTFVWDDFCSIFLEIAKPAYGEGIDPAAYESVIRHFESVCILLHPFMPFITEEIWHQLRERAPGADCMLASSAHTRGDVDTEVIGTMSHILTVKSAVMDLRNQYQLSPKETMVLVFPSEPDLIRLWNVPGAEYVLHKLANATCAEGLGTGVNFLADKYQYVAVLDIAIDKDAELARMKEELAYYRGFIESVDKKLLNERFMANAKPDVVAKEQQKKADGVAKVEQLLKSIAALEQ
jgi:valyl-tRNA synthetase